MADQHEQTEGPRRVSDLHEVIRLLQPYGDAAARMRCVVELMILGVNSYKRSIFATNGREDNAPIIMIVMDLSVTLNVVELFITEENITHLETFLQSSAVGSELWGKPFFAPGMQRCSAEIVISVAERRGCTVGPAVHREIFVMGDQQPPQTNIPGVIVRPLSECHVEKVLSRWPHRGGKVNPADIVLEPVRAGLSMGLFTAPTPHPTPAADQRQDQQEDQQHSQQHSQQDRQQKQDPEHHQHRCGKGRGQAHTSQLGESNDDAPEAAKHGACVGQQSQLPPSTSDTSDPPLPSDCLQAWMVVKTYGDAGFLWTEESCRGRGYGSAVLAELTRACVRRGLRPTSATTDDNTPALRLLQRHGFRYMYSGSFFTVTPKLKPE